MMCGPFSPLIVSLVSTVTNCPNANAFCALADASWFWEALYGLGELRELVLRTLHSLRELRDLCSQGRQGHLGRFGIRPRLRRGLRAKRRWRCERRDEQSGTDGDSRFASWFLSLGRWQSHEASNCHEI